MVETNQYGEFYICKNIVDGAIAINSLSRLSGTAIRKFMFSTESYDSWPRAELDGWRLARVALKEISIAPSQSDFLTVNQLKL